MRFAKAKIEGTRFIDAVGITNYENFYGDVMSGEYGEADIVDFAYVKDPQTNAYQEQHILCHMMRHLYNTRQTHGIYCRTCDTWKFGRSPGLFNSPCDDHDTVTIAITCCYEEGEALTLLRDARDRFCSSCNGEHGFHIFVADDHFSTSSDLAVIEFHSPEGEEQLHQMIDSVREICPELLFAAMEPANCYVTVKNHKR